MNYDIYEQAGNSVGFYDTLIWKEGEPKQEFFKLFCWTLGDENYGTGQLIENLFNTKEKKIAYLKGILKRYGSDNQTLNFSNSQGTVERFKRWSMEIYTNKILSPIIEHKINYHTFPICHTLILTENFYKFLVNYEL